MSAVRTRTALTLAAVAAVTALLVVPAVAPAAVTCDYSSSGKLLTVALGASGDPAVLSVVAGEIKVAQGLTPVACTGPGGPPSVTNTGAISVTGNGQSFQKITISGADDFVPGPDPQDGSDNGGGTKEIEIFVNMNGGLESTLEVGTGDSAGGRIVFGANGINPNPVGESGDDADIFPNNVETLAGAGGTGHDELFAQGGQGTGAPLTEDVSLLGGEGIDQIEGGEGLDSLFGGPGGDTLFGGGGSDELHPGQATTPRTAGARAAMTPSSYRPSGSPRRSTSRSRSARTPATGPTSWWASRTPGRTPAWERPCAAMTAGTCSRATRATTPWRDAAESTC